MILLHILDLLVLIFFCFTRPDALLADLENTGSPLARCPVLLTSDPPEHSNAATEEPAPTRPPPPAYTPQQVEQESLGMSIPVIPSLISFTFPSLSHKFSCFLLSDGFCCHENFPEFQPRQTVQVSLWRWWRRLGFFRLGCFTGQAGTSSGHKGVLAPWEEWCLVQTFLQLEQIV